MIMVSVIWVGAAHQLRIDMCALVYIAHNATIDEGCRACTPVPRTVEDNE